MSEDWKPKFKWYPHFDRFLPEEEILKIVRCKTAVTKNAFFPFLLYYETKMKFGRTKGKPRPIRYASRRDSYIYAYYRHLLSLKYEETLTTLGISDCVIAYRKIPVADGKKSGKCNIHFAREAFKEIESRKSCYAVALDISGFFDSIDHQNLKNIWCRLMGVNDLEEDHAAVFKSITQYADVDYMEALKVLGYYGDVKIKDVEKQGFLFEKKTMQMQLCSPKDFKEKICGKNGKYKNLINKDKNRTCGIPQGSTMSDILANMSLLDFDLKIQRLAEAHESYYRRYSDDILIICPKDPEVLNKIISSIKEEITMSGKELKIKDEKTLIKEFTHKDEKLYCRFLDSPDYPDQAQPPLKNKSFEYLGFSYDGKTVLLKNGTISRYYQKMTFGIRSLASELVDRYPNKPPEELFILAKISQVLEKYGRIDEFGMTESNEYKDWTFWTYAKRSAVVMKDFDNKILHQVRNYKKQVVRLLKTEIGKAYTRKKLGAKEL